jgi:hypothetical protein
LHALDAGIGFLDWLEAGMESESLFSLSVPSGRPGRDRTAPRSPFTLTLLEGGYSLFKPICHTHKPKEATEAPWGHLEDSRSLVATANRQ